MATPPGLSGTPSPADLLRGLQRHLALALSLGLIFGTLSALGVWFVYKTTRYSTQSLLAVASTTPQLVPTQRVVEETRLADYQTTQATYIKSRLVLGAAIRRPGIAALPSLKKEEDPIIWLAENLSVKFNGEIMTIGMEGDNPAEIIKLVGAVTDSYLDEVVNREKDLKLTRYNQLKELVADYREDLKRRRDTNRQLAEKAGSKDSQTLAFKQQLLLDQMSQTNRQLFEVLSRIRESEIQLSMLRPEAAGADSPTGGTATKPAEKAAVPDEKPAVDPATVESIVNRHPAVQEIQDQISELERGLSNHRRLTRSQSDPAIRRSLQELTATRQELDSVRQSVRQEVINQLAETASRGNARDTALAAGGPALANKQDAKLLEEIIKFNKQYEQDLRANAKKLDDDSKALTDNTLEIEATQEDIEHAEEYARRLESETERLKVELDAPARVDLIEKAEVAMPLSIKKKAMLTGVTGLGTLGLILAGFAWWDARTRRVARADDIVQSLGMNLVGILPALPTRTQRRALARRNAAPAWEHMLMESVDATRTMLLHASRNEQVRVVMVTSAVKGEGKTSLASHLATSLARARQRTLLIDGDLRSPTLHALFDLTRGPGLAELLRGECDMVDALQATPAPSLTLITGGHVDPDAIASLAEGRLQPILAQARDQFDFIIVDSAPVLPVADSLQICQHVDAVLFSVLRDVSRLPKIHAAYERLSSLGVRFLGAVVAGTKTDRDSYYAAYPYASTSSSSTSL